MATTNYQFRLIVRPTALGQAIVSRLEAPGADRTAEARRWLELGFAAEQAGFRMDGQELRHADRAWTVQPTVWSTASPAAGPPLTQGSAIANEASEGEGAAPQRAAPEAPAAASAATTDQPLLRSLRGLSAA